MTHKTKGIVLRTVKYGETSLVVSVLTELFGLQSYLVNGVRTAAKSAAGKAAMLQPAAILDLVVYHNELKNLQRIRELRWASLYEHLLFDVVKNAVAVFMIELLQKCLKQPEENADLFLFTEDALQHLDQAPPGGVGNYPLFFALHLAAFFGWGIDDNYGPSKPWLDLQEGHFCAARPDHPYALEDPLSGAVAQLLRARHPDELPEIGLNREKRQALLDACQDFYRLHAPGFTPMRTLPVLRTLLSG